MAFTKNTNNGLGRISETVTLGNSASVYTSEIDDIKVRADGTNQYVTFAFEASAVSGTNLDITLHGASTTGGTKFVLKDVVVADITDTTKVVGVIDMNAYPAPYYYIQIKSDADESSNTIIVEVFGDLV